MAVKKSPRPSPSGKSKPTSQQKKRNHPSFPDRKQATKQSLPKAPRPPAAAHKRKRRTYTDKELNLPKLNTITPAGVQAPKRGKKKHKVFVEDNESMVTIMALVRAEKEGAIESQLARARQMEEVRVAREREREVKAERRQEDRRQMSEDLRRKRKRPEKDGGGEERRPDGGAAATGRSTGKKRVSFA